MAMLDIFAPVPTTTLVVKTAAFLYNRVFPPDCIDILSRPMKALVLTAYNLMEIQDWPRPEIAADEVLLRVAACGICGSDIHGMDGSTGRRQPPIVMGHEASGTVVEVGAEVRDWAAGDRVTFDSTIYCGRCWFCRRGEINLCDNRRVLGVSCDDYRRHGAFAEFVAVPQHVLYRVPAEVSFVHAALVEPLSIALHAVARSSVTIGDTAVVVGTGMVGLLVVQASASQAAEGFTASTSMPAACNWRVNSGPTKASARTRWMSRPKYSAARAGAGPTWPWKWSASRPPCNWPWPCCGRAAS